MATKRANEAGRAKAKTVRVEMKVDAALRRQWKAALARLSGADRDEAGAFDAKWETIGEILSSNPPLYLAGGYATARAFIAAHVGEDERTTRRNVLVAKYASPAEEVRYGVTKLDAALAYLEEKTGRALSGRLPVAFDRLRFRVSRADRKTATLNDATLEEIRTATRALRKDDGQRRARDPLVRAVEAALRVAGVRGVRVRVRVADGELGLAGIRQADVAKVGRALMTVRVPPAAKP